MFQKKVKISNQNREKIKRPKTLAVKTLIDFWPYLQRSNNH